MYRPSTVHPARQVATSQLEQARSTERRPVTPADCSRPPPRPATSLPCEEAALRPPRRRREIVGEPVVPPRPSFLDLGSNARLVSRPAKPASDRSSPTLRSAFFRLASLVVWRLRRHTLGYAPREEGRDVDSQHARLSLTADAQELVIPSKGHPTEGGTHGHQSTNRYNHDPAPHPRPRERDRGEPAARDMIRAGAESDRDTRVPLVAPALNSRLRHWLSDTDAAQAAARARLQRCVGRLADAGVEANAMIGDSDPLQAAADALRLFDATLILVATHPEQRSNWLARRVGERVRGRFGLPVVHIVVDPERQIEYIRKREGTPVPPLLTAA
jgi:hypothetical protein